MEGEKVSKKDALPECDGQRLISPRYDCEGIAGQSRPQQTARHRAS
jgi:hypothetical protein